jgi:TANFOR domain-containing protein
MSAKVKFIKILFLCLLFTTSVFAGDLNVFVTVTPPYTPFVSDYFSVQSKTMVTINNPSRLEYRILLRGKFEGDNGVTLSTNPSYKPPVPITIPAFGNVTIFGNQLEKYFDVNTMLVQGVKKQDLISGGGLPEGFYKICVQAFDYDNTSIPRSDPSPSGCSGPFTIQLIEPPFTIMPMCNEVVTPMNPQNLVFTWTTPSKVSTKTKYLLKIVELPLNARNVGDALQNVTVPPFFEKTLTTNSYIYGMADPILQVGRKYAYSITAFESESFPDRPGNTLIKNIGMRNNGQSEPCMFQYGEITGTTIPLIPKSSSEEISLQGIKFTPDYTFQPIPKSVIKGKIEYAFYKDEEKEDSGIFNELSNPIPIPNSIPPNNDYFPLKNTPQKQSITNTGNKKNSILQSDNSSKIFSPKGDFVISEVPNTNLDKLLGIEQKKQDFWGDMQKSMAAQAGTKRYPLANQSIELRAFLTDEIMKFFIQQKAINPNAKIPPNNVLIGTTQTDADGNFALAFYKNDIDLSFYNIELSLKNNMQFYLPPIPVAIVPDEEGTYDMGNVLCLANTFRLKVKVIGGQGKELNEATVKIMRADGFYKNKIVLNPEGNRSTMTGDKKVNTKKSEPKQEVNTQPIVMQALYGLELAAKNSIFELVGEIKGSKVQKRLFEGIDNSEVYYLHIEAPDHYPLTVPLAFIKGQNFGTSGWSVNAKYNNSILEVSGTYNLKIEPSSVQGKVVDKEKEVVLPNQTVTLYNKKDNKLVFTTKTDNEGKFLINNVPPSSYPYYIKVDGDVVKNFEHPDAIYIESEGVKVNVDPLYVKAQLFPITGIVSDMNDVVLNNAELTWKSGGKSFYTNEKGLYLGYNVGGKHILVIKKPGYRTKEIEVDLKLPEQKGKGVIELGDVKQFGTKELLNQYGNVQLQSKNGINFNNVVLNNNYNKSQQKQKFEFINQQKIDEMTPINIGDILINNNQGDAPTITLDTIKLSRFMVKVKVLDDDSKSVLANAKVIVNEDEDSPFATDVNGSVVLDNATEGSTKLFVYGPEGLNYIPQSVVISVNAADDTSFVEVSLKSGGKLSGEVTSAGNKLKDAEVYLEGKNFIKTKTDSEGKYQLFVPEGEYTVVASKVGLLADKKVITFEKLEYVQNFDLKDPGFNASKLLGFDLLLTESVPTGNPNEFKISGSLVNIPSNSLFSINKSKKLEFYDCIILKQGDNIAPKDGFVKLAETNFSFNLWDYLKLSLKDPLGIKVKHVEGDVTKGVINGEIEIDITGTFGMSYGLKWPAGKYLLSEDGIASMMNVFYSVNPEVDISALKLKAPAVGWEIHGILLSPDLSKTKISKDGIEFAGSLQIKDIPGLENTILNLNSLQIGTNGDIKKVEISVNPNPKLQLGSWSMTIKSGNINQYGLKFGGEVAIPIPGSSNALFKFNNVNVNKSGINGGTYSLSGPINIFDVVKFSGSVNNPMSFSKIPGQSHYKINGGGDIELPKFINKKIVINNLVIATNGEFGLTCSPNFEVEFASLAALKIKKFDLYPAKKEFAIDGGFRLNIPGVGAEAGGYLHYKPGSAWLDKLNIGASLGGVGNFKAEVDFSESNGFKGKGGIELVSLLSMAMEFTYYSNNQGKIISAAVSTGVMIPVGVVTFENIGGGFLYNSIDKKYGVNLTGRMTLAPGTSALVALDQIKIGVYMQQGGVLFEGSAVPKVVSMDVGIAQFKLDIPNKNFFVNAELKKKMEIFPGLGFDAAGGFMLAASAKQNDQYWLVGLYTRLKMMGIIDQNMNITGAWNLNRAAHPEFNDYTLFIPDQFLNSGKINGFNARFSSLKGVQADNPKCGGISDFAELCMYAYANMDISLYSNFISNTYGMGISQSWGAGGSADFFGVGIAGADISVGYALSGGYGGGNWFISGEGNASAKAYIGCSGSGCSNGLSWGCCFNACVVGCKVCPCPCGGRICLSPSVKASYYSNVGKFNVNINW